MKGKRLVHTSNASASASKHTCELPQRKCKRKKWTIFHFLALAFALSFAFTRVNRGNANAKRKMKNTRSMPLRLISFPESSFPNCWSGVTQTLGTRLPPTMRVRISFCLRLRWACERRLRLRLRLPLRLRRTCEPAFRSYPMSNFRPD